MINILKKSTILFTLGCLVNYSHAVTFAVDNLTANTISSTTPIPISSGGTGNTTSTVVNLSGGSVAATTITASGLITPSYPAGIKGNTTSGVTAGSIGEGQLATPALISITTDTFTEAASLVLGPGVWIVFGSVYFKPDASTIQTYLTGGIHNPTSVLPPFPEYFISGITRPAGQDEVISLPTQYFIFDTQSTIQCIVKVIFSVSTEQVQCALRAVRIG